MTRTPPPNPDFAAGMEAAAVPRVPTPAMIAAAWDVVDKAKRGSGIARLMPGLGVREIWEAMYAAAIRAAKTPPREKE